MTPFTTTGMLADLSIGLAIGFVLMVLITKLRRSPFEITDLDGFGSGPVTVTPENGSEWIVWLCDDKLPPGVRLHTTVQVRYVDGTVSEPRYAGAFYWGRYERYPASGSHVAAYRIVRE